MIRMLIVEDEADLADALSDGLQAEGYHVDVVYDGASALAHADAFAVDLIVLDRDLPLLSGDAVCRALVAQRHPARIIMLTASGQPGDSVTGLDLGADDYIAKPFDYAELLARVRAVSRRDKASEPDLVWNDLHVSRPERTVRRAQQPISLAPKEFQCLQIMMGAGGRVVTFSELVERVWPAESETSRGAVKAVIHSLRRKLGQPDLIATQHGVGYKMRRPA